MAPIRSRKRNIEQSFRLSTSAAASLLAFVVPHVDAIAQSSDKALPTVSVTAPVINDYKPPETLSSPKYTAPLLDTPQTITVVPKKVIEDQNLQGLREILATIPGITFGAGEGGGGYGDSINIRGFSGSNDVTLDGVRDSAQYTRSDTFNIEQVEIINGANSVYSGAGSVGGSVNLVSKTPKADDFAIFSGGLGTDNYGRATADVNKVVSDGIALRLNAMVHKNDVPGRDYEDFGRWGIAPSISFGLGTSTQIIASYVHQHDNNTPQYGVPYFNNAFHNGPLPGVDTDNYYGYHNLDEQKIDSDIFTLTLDHDLNKKASIRNLTRAGKVSQYSQTSAPQGTWCLADGTNASNGNACGFPGTYQPWSRQAAGNANIPTNSFNPGPRGNVRDSENTIIYNQTDLTTNFNTGSVEHTLVGGASLTHEEFDFTGYSLLRKADGSIYLPGDSALFIANFPRMDLNDPDSTYYGDINKTRSGKTTGEMDNAAVYLFDTAKLNQYWELNGGLRWERNEGESVNYTISNGSAFGNNPAGTAGQIMGREKTEDNNTLFSYRAGVVFKPQPNGSVYFAYANTETPSKASVNGSCTTTATANAGASCGVDPEESVSYELGTKWDVLNNQLSLTAAIFRNDRTNYRVADQNNPDNPSGIAQLDGEARVDGLLLGAAGLITKSWSVFANYAYLKSEVLQGASAFVSATVGDPTKGDELTNVPKHSFSLWTTYDVGSGWQVGYGATYQGSMAVSQQTDTVKEIYKTDPYWVHRAMVAYKVNRQLGLQLNVNNLFDEEYYERIRNNGWATPGAARSATLTATYQF